MIRVHHDGVHRGFSLGVPRALLGTPPAIVYNIAAFCAFIVIFLKFLAAFVYNIVSFLTFFRGGFHRIHRVVKYPVSQRSSLVS